MPTAVLLPRHKLTVDHYHKMAEAGILTALDRVELIEGELIDMAPIGSRHATRVDYLTRLLVKQVSEERLVRVQNPVRLGKHSEPEPDIAIVQNRRYSKAHPVPKDVLLLIEVADTTVQYDRDIKIPLYARHPIPTPIKTKNCGNGWKRISSYSSARGSIQDWHDRRISAGTEWAGQIDHYLESAQIILLLISADKRVGNGLRPSKTLQSEKQIGPSVLCGAKAVTTDGPNRELT